MAEDRDLLFARRLVALGDIVVGFSLAQLALQLTRPKTPSDLLAHVFEFIGFFATFAIICSFWMIFHRANLYVRKATQRSRSLRLLRSRRWRCCRTHSICTSASAWTQLQPAPMRSASPRSSAQTQSSWRSGKSNRWRTSIPTNSVAYANGCGGGPRSRSSSSHPLHSCRLTHGWQSGRGGSLELPWSSSAAAFASPQLRPGLRLGGTRSPLAEAS